MSDPTAMPPEETMPYPQQDDDNEAPLVRVRTPTGYYTSRDEPVPSTGPAGIIPHAGASELQITDQALNTLTAPTDERLFDILPTGEIYLSQVHVRTCLSQAFGPGGWALVPMEPPRVEYNTMIQRWALYVRGHYVSESFGEAEYQPSNARMTWATVTEAVKSNALTRCCKDLGIGREAWDSRFAAAWKEKYAVKVWRSKAKGGKGEYQWRRKDAPPFYDEAKGSAKTDRPEGDVHVEKTSTISEPQRKSTRKSHGPAKISAAHWQSQIEGKSGDSYDVYEVVTEDGEIFITTSDETYKMAVEIKHSGALALIHWRPGEKDATKKIVSAIEVAR